MDLAFSADDQALRREIRDYLYATVPPAWRFRHNPIEWQAKEAAGWIQKTLHVRGWSVPNWPVEYGGPGWTAVQQTIFHAECARAGAPLPWQFGPIMISLVIYTFGTDARKARHLPGIRDGSVFWCQGYSEPGAESDLASVKTRAERGIGLAGPEAIPLGTAALPAGPTNQPDHNVGGRYCCNITSSSAPPAFTAAPPKCSARSLPRQYWGFDHAIRNA